METEEEKAERFDNGLVSEDEIYGWEDFKNLLRSFEVFEEEDILNYAEHYQNLNNHLRNFEDFCGFLDSEHIEEVEHKPSN